MHETNPSENWSVVSKALSGKPKVIWKSTHQALFPERKENDLITDNDFAQ